MIDIITVSGDSNEVDKKYDVISCMQFIHIVEARLGLKISRRQSTKSYAAGNYRFEAYFTEIPVEVSEF